MYDLDMPASFITDRKEVLSELADPLFQNIRDRVYSSPQMFLSKYDTYLRNIIKGTPTIDKAVDVFYSRAKGIGGTVIGDVIQTPGKNFLLFPEASGDYKAAPSGSVPQKMQNLLETLSSKSGIPFQVINDKTQKFKGRYIFDGDERIVLINLAYADLSTPLHEYYHPIVRLLHTKNEKLFDSILQEARQVAVDDRTDSEELVTEYLAKLASRPTSTFTRFMSWLTSFLRRTLGITKPIDKLNSIGDLLKFTEDSLSAGLEEYTLSKADSDLMQILNNMTSSERTNFRVKKDESGLDYVDALAKLAVEQNVTTDDTSQYYKDASGTDVAVRLTQFIGDRDLGEFSVKYKDKRYSFAEYAARETFKRQGYDTKDLPVDEVTDTVIFEGNPLTLKQLIDKIETVFAQQRIYGKMVHAFIQYKLERDPQKKEQAKQLATTYALQAGTTFVSLETHGDLIEYEQNFEKVLAVAGIRLSGAVPDRVAPEASIMSKIVKDSQGKFIGTTIDSLIQHSNADVSLVDWKTGNILNDALSTAIMAYSGELNLPDSKLSRAYLEMAYRAVILKEHFPDMRFRKIGIAKLSKSGNHTFMELDLQPYLTLIGNYYKKVNPEVYEELKKANLLSVKSYLGTKGELVRVLPYGLHLAPMEDQLAYLQAKLDKLSYGMTPDQMSKYPDLREEIRMYTEAILEIKKQPGMDLDEKTPDIPGVTGLTKNFSDISNPKVQVLHKEILKAKAKASADTRALVEQHDKLAAEVVKESVGITAKTFKKLLTIPLVYSIITLNAGVLIPTIAIGLILRRYGKTTKDVFGFMWKKSEDAGRTGYFLNTTDFHEGVPLTAAQRAYRDYFVSSMRQTYYSVMDEAVASTQYDRVITRAEALNKPAELPADFMPRVPIGVSEIRENQPYWSGFFGLQTSAKHFVQSQLTDHLANAYTSEDGRQPIPLKYFGHTGSVTVEESNHSFDPTKAYSMFIGNLIYKQNFDHLYNLAHGVKVALDMETDEAGNARYQGLTKWLDLEIYSQILNTHKPSSFTTSK